MKIDFILNGKEVSIECSPVKKLIHIIRDDFGLIGTKEGCTKGECGACLVLLNDLLVNSCLIPAFVIHNKRVLTIEGVYKTKEFIEIENMFMQEKLVRCGYCIPGLVMSTKALLTEKQNPSDEEIREVVSGNLCQCNSDQHIIQAIKKIYMAYTRKKNARRG